ncbi:MAG: hypothetical protein GF383_10400 [Candidatus Lokiarchaeota archaeon]|nr:hypothetical protein [Candidatus Lokiarchaeota archaeon]MBD3340971.1 hypothetical protein [Candidatus Lokiarchaeota archaeon]
MKKISTKEYYNQVLGSWYGRVAGDYIGAPIEFHPYREIEEKYGEINYYIEPIDLNYVNDDEMYEICALIALEDAGINLNSKQIAEKWVELLYRDNFTAERRALKNLNKGVFPPKSGTYKNVYYDAIGAQMRADIWGQITPGCPHLAKEYAIIDGAISHAGIGIEGEIFIAVLISQAFFQKDIEKNIEEALSYLPSFKESLYSQMVLRAYEIYLKHSNDFRRGREELINYWNRIRKNVLLQKELDKENIKLFDRKRIKFLSERISEVHVLPNIGLIILALLYGNEDEEDPLGRSICLAAMMGLDTDCNCGNIGAILGATMGADNIPEKWISPLQNSFSTYVKGYEKWKITELSERISFIGKKVISNKCEESVKIS